LGVAHMQMNLLFSRITAMDSAEQIYEIWHGIHPVLRLILLMLKSPECYLWGLGGYMRDFIRWHLYPEVKRHLDVKMMDSDWDHYTVLYYYGLHDKMIETVYNYDHVKHYETTKRLGNYLSYSSKKLNSIMVNKLSADTYKILYMVGGLHNKHIYMRNLRNTTYNDMNYELLWIYNYIISGSILPRFLRNKIKNVEINNPFLEYQSGCINSYRDEFDEYIFLLNKYDGFFRDYIINGIELMRDMKKWAYDIIVMTWLSKIDNDEVQWLSVEIPKYIYHYEAQMIKKEKKAIYQFEKFMMMANLSVRKDLLRQQRIKRLLKISDKQSDDWSYNVIRKAFLQITQGDRTTLLNMI
jgi:hypothetical protein